MISIQNATFEYTGDKAALENINLEIARGECVLLCGESGCGKTTLTKTINGLIPHFSEDSVLQGKVTVDSLLVADTELYELAKKVGSVFQNPKSQFFNLDSDSELAFGLENEGAEPEYIEKRINETIKQLRIEKLQGRSIFAMSGGEKQMLAFASVFAMNPAIFVLDEPSANLDENAIEQLRKQIVLLKSQGYTIIIAEHRLYFLTDIIDRAVYMRNGRIEHIFDVKEFTGLSGHRRKELGLRGLEATSIQLPQAAVLDAGQGLSADMLTCAYGRHVVFRNLSFSVKHGDAVAVVGGNGVGKSTLIRCLCGLLKEQTGKVMLNGKELKPKQRQRLSFCVMQDVNHQLFSDSCRGECEMANPKATDKEIESVLERLQLSEFKERHPLSVSGGQKQRLAVAAAMLSKKEIIIFDEPTSGLDYARMEEVSKIVRSVAEAGHIVLVVSHDKEFISRSCDRVLAL